jgi:hypothetical protein
VERGQEEGVVANACAGRSDPAGINSGAKLKERKQPPHDEVSRIVEHKFLSQTLFLPVSAAKKKTGR